jgi:ubiquinone/menaquinone biosynthesis C-methylase UbiE
MTGNPSETVIDLYRRHAVQWDAARRSSGWNDRVWIKAFANELAEGSRVLDLGCGGGEPVARLLVEHGMQVTGVDSSPAMVALARDRIPGQEWLVADMRRLALSRRFEVSSPGTAISILRTRHSERCSQCSMPTREVTPC